MRDTNYYCAPCIVVWRSLAHHAVDLHYMDDELVAELSASLKLPPVKRKKLAVGLASRRAGGGSSDGPAAAPAPGKSGGGGGGGGNAAARTIQQARACFGINAALENGGGRDPATALHEGKISPLFHTNCTCASLC